jgi:hypothetical protein
MLESYGYINVCEISATNHLFHCTDSTCEFQGSTRKEKFAEFMDPAGTKFVWVLPREPVAGPNYYIWKAAEGYVNFVVDCFGGGGKYTIQECIRRHLDEKEMATPSAVGSAANFVKTNGSKKSSPAASSQGKRSSSTTPSQNKSINCKKSSPAASSQGKRSSSTTTSQIVKKGYRRHPVRLYIVRPNSEVHDVKKTPQNEHYIVYSAVIKHNTETAQCSAHWTQSNDLPPQVHSTSQSKVTTYASDISSSYAESSPQDGAGGEGAGGGGGVGGNSSGKVGTPGGGEAGVSDSAGPKQCNNTSVDTTSTEPALTDCSSEATTPSDIVAFIENERGSRRLEEAFLHPHVREWLLSSQFDHLTNLLHRMPGKELLALCQQYNIGIKKFGGRGCSGVNKAYVAGKIEAALDQELQAKLHSLRSCTPPNL